MKEKKLKKHIPEPVHFRKKREEVSNSHKVMTNQSHQTVDKKHSRRRSKSKEDWSPKQDRARHEMVDQKKIRELQQIKQLMEMKQQIKKELRMSQNAREESSPKRRKHSRSPPHKKISSPQHRIPTEPHRYSSNHQSQTHRSFSPSLSNKLKRNPSPPPPPPHQSVSKQVYKHRRDDRQGGRFDSRDRYEGGDRRHDGWRDEGRGGAGGNWSGGDKSNNDQWSQSSGPSHDRSWNNNSNKGRGGYNSGPSRGGGSSAPGYNRGGPPGHNMGGQSNMNPYPQPQQHNFNPYPPPKY